MPSRIDIRVFTLFFIALAYAPSMNGLTHAQGPQAGLAPAPQLQLPTDPAAIVAVVGESKILFGDVKPRVDARIEEVLKQTKQEIPEEQLTMARVNLTRSLLVQSIQNKMMREAFLLDQVGTQGADKLAEAREMISSRARQMFHKSEVPELMKRNAADNLIELDDKLRLNGTTLAAREREFMDAMLGHMYMKSVVNRDPNVTIAEINDFYVTHRNEYAHPAKAKWEQLSVLFANHPRDEADKLIREMGREAYFGGNVQAVARENSEEPFASSGGLHDWTSKGSLASKELDKMIFELPLNRLSDVIEDEVGFHIIRVLDRKDAGVATLATKQEEIREKIKAEKVAKSQKKMLKELHDRVPVWTIFPDDIPGAKSLYGPQFATVPIQSRF